MHVWLKHIKNLTQRFSKESMNLTNSVDALLVLSYSKRPKFINHYKINKLFFFLFINKLQIITPDFCMRITFIEYLCRKFKGRNVSSAKCSKAIDWYPKDQISTLFEMSKIVTYNNFSNLYRLIIEAYTILINNAIRERTFSATHNNDARQIFKFDVIVHRKRFIQCHRQL